LHNIGCTRYNSSELDYTLVCTIFARPGIVQASLSPAHGLSIAIAFLVAKIVIFSEKQPSTPEF